MYIFISSVVLYLKIYKIKLCKHIKQIPTLKILFTALKQILNKRREDEITKHFLKTGDHFFNSCLDLSINVIQFKDDENDKCSCK